MNLDGRKVVVALSYEGIDLGFERGRRRRRRRGRRDGLRGEKERKRSFRFLGSGLGCDMRGLYKGDERHKFGARGV